MTAPRWLVVAVGIALGLIVIVTVLAVTLWSWDSGGDDREGRATTIAMVR